MYVTSQKLIYLAVLKQACRDYVEWKRNADSRLIEVEKFLQDIDCDGCEIDGKWLMDSLNEFVASDRKRFWRQDIASLYKIAT